MCCTYNSHIHLSIVPTTHILAWVDIHLSVSRHTSTVAAVNTSSNLPISLSNKYGVWPSTSPSGCLLYLRWTAHVHSFPTCWARPQKASHILCSRLPCKVWSKNDGDLLAQKAIQREWLILKQMFSMIFRKPAVSFNLKKLIRLTVIRRQHRACPE